MRLWTSTTIRGPGIITESGRYCVASEIDVAAGHGITIIAPGVTLLLGAPLRSLATDDELGIGINVEATAADFTLKGEAGFIEGFYAGVRSEAPRTLLDRLHIQRTRYH